MRVSIVLTTHNRPGLLAEAIGSVLAQDSRDWELIVVDDGSSPAATISGLASSEHEGRVQMVRHSEARGPSEARNTGVKNARGDVVTFLDDDDLLPPCAVREIRSVMADEIDCLFVKVGCFGSLAPGTIVNQDRALHSLLHNARGDVPAPGRVIRLDSHRLFRAMLTTLPMAFQRPSIRREHMSVIGPYRGTSFGDLEFNFRAVLRSRTALLNDEMYLVRCEGQSYFSRSESANRLQQATISVREQLLEVPEVRRDPRLRGDVRRAISNAHFDLAWWALRNGAPLPWRDVAQSCRGGIGKRHISLVGRAIWRAVSGRASRAS
jgi:glycosyltransferase involved in cell wall biosynthesis